MRALFSSIFLLALPFLAFGQTYTTQLIAGGALPINVPGTSASLYGPDSVAVDKAGNLFFTNRDVVLRLDAASGVLSLVAGNGTSSFTGDDGPATSAQLWGPSGVAVDADGNIYITDINNHRIRRVSGGVITTVAGRGSRGYNGDNIPATSAWLNRASGIAVDRAGNLYIADTSNHRIRKVSGGVITTVAGTGVQGYSGDNGPATSAELNWPGDIAVDAAGNLYIADTWNDRIRKVSDGVITTVAGDGTAGYSGDNGPATSAQLREPFGIALDAAGNLYIADTYNSRIRKISDGVITTVAGNGAYGYGGDNGPATSAELNEPFGVALDAAGNLYIADFYNFRIRKVSNGVITTVAGNGKQCYSGDNGPATSAQLGVPWGIAVDAAGDLYTADYQSLSIRKVSGGVIATVAGDGTPGYNGDNRPATGAQVARPTGMAVDAAGNLYIADTANLRIRKVSGGVITTVAGNGMDGYGGDNGPATSAQLSLPKGVAVDAAGNLYIADTVNQRVRRVSGGVITTVAGNGTQGYSGDNGPATSAQLSNPSGLAVDASGNLYIADTGNARIRKVSGGVITTVAGGGTLFRGDNSPATSVRLASPYGVATDAAGNLFIADTWNSWIRRVSGGVITVVGGDYSAGYSGDNAPATYTRLNNPAGVTVDAAGNVYVTDGGNGRILMLIPSGASCSYSVSPTTLTPSSVGGSLTVPIQTSASCNWVISNLPDWITVQGLSSGSGDLSVTLVVAGNPGAPRAAYPTVAGVTVPIVQQGAIACSYSLSAAGLALPAAGGPASLTITAPGGCLWEASNGLSWITNLTPTSGTGSGVVTFQVAANANRGRSGTLTIAGAPFTVQQAGSVTGLNVIGSMAQIASGGLWNTTITLVNNGATTATARLNFFETNGNPLQLPLTFPQSSSEGPLLASTLDQTIAPGAVFVIRTAGQESDASVAGWAQLLASGNIGGFAVFAWNPGAGAQQAVAPLETRNPNSFVLYFDNTNGSTEGVALANVAAQAVTVPVTIRDDSGTVVASTTQPLAALGHTQFMVTDLSPLTANKRGTVEFQTPSGGQISVLGIAALPTGAITSVPATTKP